MTLRELLRYARIGLRTEHLIDTTTDTVMLGIRTEHLIDTTTDAVMLGIRVNNLAYIYEDYLDDDLEDLRILEEIELDNLS